MGSYRTRLILLLDHVHNSELILTYFCIFYSGMSCKLTRSPSFLSLTLGQGPGLGRLPAAFAPDPAPAPITETLFAYLTTVPWIRIHMDPHWF